MNMRFSEFMKKVDNVEKLFSIIESCLSKGMSIDHFTKLALKPVIERLDFTSEEEFVNKIKRKVSLFTEAAPGGTGGGGPAPGGGGGGGGPAPGGTAGGTGAGGTGAKPAGGTGAGGTGTKPAGGTGAKPAGGTGAKPAGGTGAGGGKKCFLAKIEYNDKTKIRKIYRVPSTAKPEQVIKAIKNQIPNIKDVQLSPSNESEIFKVDIHVPEILQSVRRLLLNGMEFAIGDASNEIIDTYKNSVSEKEQAALMILHQMEKKIEEYIKAGYKPNFKPLQKTADNYAATIARNKQMADEMRGKKAQVAKVIDGEFGDEDYSNSGSEVLS